MPPIDPAVGQHFKACALEYIKTLPTVKAVPTFHEWIQQAPYSNGRKKYFNEIWKELQHTGGRPKFHKSKSFLKWEPYVKGKQSRAINSPSDRCKVIFGPIQWAIDKILFQDKHFMKGKNPKDWPAELLELFGEEEVMGTDFTSFEAHHRGVFSDIGYAWIAHSLRGAPVSNNLKRLYLQQMCGRNECDFRGLKVSVDQRLMSGVMWTSSDNGLKNLLSLAYLTWACPKKDPKDFPEHVRRSRIRVEGDDGIFPKCEIDPKRISDLGMKLKLDEYQNFRTASFCGIMSDGKQLHADPWIFIRKFFLMEPKYQSSKMPTLNALLRTKALSYKYLFNDTPVIGPICQNIVDQTRHLDIRKYTSSTEIGGWKSAFTKQAINDKIWLRKPNVTAEARAFVAEQFGMDERTQRILETGGTRPAHIEMSHRMTKDDVTLMWLPAGFPPHVHESVRAFMRKGTRKSAKAKCLVP
jgi:hypothetical protein